MSPISHPPSVARLWQSAEDYAGAEYNHEQRQTGSRGGYSGRNIFPNIQTLNISHAFSLNLVEKIKFSFLLWAFTHGYYGFTRWIEDDCPATFSEYIFLFPSAAALCHDFSLVDSVET